MDIVIREYQTEDVTAAITIWNQVLEGDCEKKSVNKILL